MQESTALQDNRDWPFAIEPMALADLDEVMAIERTAFTAPWSERAFRFEISENAHSTMLVVRPASRTESPLDTLLRSVRLVRRPVLGYGGFWLLVEDIHVSTIAVHPDWRSRGIGELLLVSMLQRGIQLGALRATLEVRISNLVAQDLYQKCGFSIVSRQRGYYSDTGEDAYVMASPPFASLRYRQLLRQRLLHLDRRFRAHDSG